MADSKEKVVDINSVVHPSSIEAATKNLADIFESVLTDEGHLLHESLWKELKRRGWDIEQTLKGELL